MNHSRSRQFPGRDVRCRLLVLGLCLVGAGLRAEVEFTDKTAELGLEPGGEAGCWADFNNDGWVDLCCSGRIWRNDRGKRFVAWPGVSVTNAVAADFDNDGFCDLFSWSALKLHRNVGGERIVEVPLPTLPKTVSRGACWGDWNNDGFVDLYVGGYEDWDAGITWPSFVLFNDGGQTFRVGQIDARFRARGVTACDFDGDGDLDIYASNYRLQPNVLWVNNGAGLFEDRASRHNALATSAGFGGGHSIGAAWGDFDNDGWFDLFAGNFAHVDDRGDQPKSRFLRNPGPVGEFVFDDRGPGGVFYQESYASPAAGDYDNDGDLDLFFTTVYGVASFGRPNFPTLFRNDGSWQFVDANAVAKTGELGPTYQAAWADFDNDGDLDLLSGGKLLVNGGASRHWLKVRLEGGGRVNRSAVGVPVRVRRGEQVWVRQVEAGTGEGNQNDLTLHFGLGEGEAAVSLEIAWPGTSPQTMTAVPVDSQQVIKRPASTGP